MRKACWLSATAVAVSAVLIVSRTSPSPAGTPTGSDARQTSPATEPVVGPAGWGEATGLRVLALRLAPGADLKRELLAFAAAHRVRAGFVMSAAGSLRAAAICLADQPGTTTYDGKFEIVSLSGTLSPDGAHLHVAFSDASGKTLGGHLSDGCTIYTTAEIVIGDATGLQFTRTPDPQTGYKELNIGHTDAP